MIDRVHAGYHRGQNLRRADVGGGFFAANVLLAGLQSQTIGRVAMGVHTDTHQTAWHRALVVIAAGQVSGVWAAGAHGHTEALRGAHHNVGVHFTGWREQCQCQQIGGHNEGCLSSVSFCNDIFQIVRHA